MSAETRSLADDSQRVVTRIRIARIGTMGQRRRVALMGSTVALAILVSACSSSKKSSTAPTSAAAAPTTSAAATAASTTAAAGDAPVKVGLVVKTLTNPFFVAMQKGAQAAAAKIPGVTLLTGAGKTDSDNAGQVTVVENMINAGAKGILITPADSKAIVPSVKKWRDQGIVIIALDSPTEPLDATDALFATCLLYTS